MSPEITLRDVGFRYDGTDRAVLSAVDLRAEAGRLTVVSGAGGSGKTTLGRIAAGLTHTLPGSLTGRLGPAVGTGWVGPGPALQRSGIAADVEEEIAFGLQFSGIDRTAMRERVVATAAALGIGSLLGRRPERLSSGEQQRVALAAVLALDADAVVLDDAAAMLDLSGRALLRDALRSATDLGRPVLAIGGPHDETLATADATHHLLDGRLLAGPPPADRPPRPWPRLVLPDPVEDPPALHLDGVGVGEVFDRLDLTIDPGTSLGVAGPNGAGKTTLVELLSGLRRPDRGVVRHGGRDVAGDSLRRCGRTVGHVFADPDQQLFARTVRDEVAFGPRQLGLDADHTDAALAAVGLLDRVDDHPYELAYGARKLLAIATVLALATPVVVLDEPTATLDPDLRARVGAVIEAVRAQGRTVVLVSHDQRLLSAHTDTILTLPV